MAWADEFTAALSGDPRYLALIANGVPPTVANSILSQPSYGEGETPQQPGRWANYRGWQQESRAAQQGDRTAALWNQMRDKRFNDALNLPTWENHTPGDDDTFGFTRLPSGQYVPAPQHSSFQGGTMPPWSQMTPQQQAMLLQMMHGGQPMGVPGQMQPGLNPNTQALTNQLANPQMGQMNPQVLQYLMGLGGGQMNPAQAMNPNLAQFLAGAPQAAAPAYSQYPGF